ncbi:kinase RLK-Pelle-CrRLK1L-1 family protein [Tanacetum coccineum]|uniref:Kinase RLK-Pelle-CrRLK1L-1 family protein n=1 Tax=Tanacetum coccineum TaxID=301880 RepID=A0ABQ5D4Y3_9ASTR
MFFPTSEEAESYVTLDSLRQPCRQFTFAEIQLATENFDESLVIGHGGFGKVYQGTIIYGATPLTAAIKRLDSTSSQGASEFWAEVKMLSRLRHSHLVSLIGYCNDGQEMILVYEYVPNGTLADRLHKRRAPLTWVRRLKICIGAARGLDYLHTDAGTKPRVIHRDVKSTYILLDNKWVAKISDFGLSKIGPTNQPSTYVNTLVRGTFGYIDPDYFLTGRLTRKSDVYAFGVVLFEVLSGKQAVDRSIDEEHRGLATWAQDSIKEGVNHPRLRPTMSQVVVVLESILALQEKTNSSLHHEKIKIYGRRIRRKVPEFLFPSNPENSDPFVTNRMLFVELLVGGTSFKSLDTFLHTVAREDRILHKFSFSIINNATENFSEANLISIDLYGSMHQGKLEDGRDISIVGPYSDTKYELCVNEVSILVKLEHKNLVQLIGYCIEGTDVFLVYDFAPYGTLDCFIYGKLVFLNCTPLDCVSLIGLTHNHTRAPLDWDSRSKIILGVARALVYLHKHAPSRIIHRDVKPDNILLDGSFEPKLSCFSIAACYAINEPGCFDTVPCGTLGHMAPECFLDNGCLTTKADVLSFGIVVLETISSFKRYKCIPGTNKCLVDYVWSNWMNGTSLNIIDPRIYADTSSVTRFIHIALLCIQENPTERPPMEEVIGMLLGSSPIELPIPNEPTWAIKKNFDADYDSKLT